MVGEVAGDVWAARFELAQPKYRKKIRTFCKKHYGKLPSYEQQDLESEILEVLWLACGSYNPNKGGGFNNYFWILANRKFLDLHKFASRKMRVGDYYRVSLEEHTSEVSDEDTGFIDPLRTQIERILHDPSAEDEVLAKFTAREIWNSR